MKLRLPHALAVLLVILAGSAWVRAEARFAAEEGDEPSALYQAMEGLKENLKPLAMNLSKSGDTAVSLRHVAEMQRYCLLAKLEDPANLSEVDEEDRAEHRVEFRREMIGLLRQLADLEEEVLGGQEKKALARIKGPLFKLRKAAHERFQAE